MRRFSAISVVALAAFAYSAGAGAPAKAQTINGYLVDVACSTENAAKPNPDFATKHDKDCLLMEECAGSGYAVLTADNKIIKFDGKSNALAREFIQDSKKDHDFKVSVTGTLEGDKLNVQSINFKD